MTTRISRVNYFVYQTGYALRLVDRAREIDSAIVELFEDRVAYLGVIKPDAVYPDNEAFSDEIEELRQELVSSIPKSALSEAAVFHCSTMKDASNISTLMDDRFRHCALFGIEDQYWIPSSETLVWEYDSESG
jgi:hypothetical protein